MTLDEANAKVSQAMSGESLDKDTRATVGASLYFETLGWTAEQYRSEILRLRLELAEYQDFDV